jgi:hypothetical protein
VTLIILLAFVSMVTPKAGAEHELLLHKTELRCLSMPHKSMQFMSVILVNGETYLV